MTMVHIHAPKGYYIGQIRLYGHRKWETVTENLPDMNVAMSLAVLAMKPGHKRSRVLFIADWYEPVVVMECNR